MNAAINVKGITVSYGVKAIIHNFSLSIPHNTFLAIVGHNGCGKSTLLRTISNLQNQDSGEIALFDKDLKSYQNAYKSGILSFLSQNNQIGFDVKVHELLLMGRHRFSKLFSNSTHEDIEALEKISKELELTELLDRNFLELSGGEQQLVLFAQTILQDAEILLLDEPTQNLDIKNGYKIIQYLDMLVQKRNKTVVISTHDLHHLSEVSGNLLNMNKGSILEKINPENIQKNIEILRN